MSGKFSGAICALYSQRRSTRLYLVEMVIKDYQCFMKLSDPYGISLGTVCKVEMMR